MKHPKKLVKDMIGHDFSIDDTHKATEGGECNSCGHEIPHTQFVKAYNKCPYCGYRLGSKQTRFDTNTRRWKE